MLPEGSLFSRPEAAPTFRGTEAAPTFLGNPKVEAASFGKRPVCEVARGHREVGLGKGERLCLWVHLNREAMSIESIALSIRRWGKGCLSVAVVVALFFCFAQWTCTSLEAKSETTLSYAIIGASSSEGLLFRTVFHFMNESGETLTAQLLVFSTDGGALEVTTSSNWAGEKGALQQAGNRVEFSVPAGSSLELALVPPASDSYTGWAKLQFEGDLAVRTIVQVGQLTHDSLPSHSLPASSLDFEHFLEQEAEIFPSTGLKNFSFPIFLFLGFKNVNTAFSIVNLSNAPGEVRLTLKPDLERTIQLQPGQLVADYFDRFWQLAFPQIFPFRLLTAARIESDVPLAVAVIRTVEGLPLSGVKVVGTPSAGSSIGVQLDTEFELAVDQAALLESENLKVTFWDVIEDSRWPVDVTCVQAGQARVVLQVSQSGQTLGEVILSTTLDGNDESVGAYSIRLIKVEPVPISTRRIDISEYRLTLLVTKI